MLPRHFCGCPQRRPFGRPHASDFTSSAHSTLVRIAVHVTQPATRGMEAGTAGFSVARRIECDQYPSRH